MGRKLTNKGPEVIPEMWMLRNSENGKFIRAIESQGDPRVVFASEKDAMEHEEHWNDSDHDWIPVRVL